ncbi:MAG: mechanosensitive ion channel [Candidatus Methanoplasma sp.]|jgi:small-conductance mechanosensitive channel|nr:mechanosensitive ion channel [Candidatus Methanoplasma sp.]
MRPASAPALLSVILAIAVLLMLPMATSCSALAAEDVGLRTHEGSLKINAGSSDDFRIEVVNYLGYAANDITNYRMVSIEFVTEPDITISVSESDKDFVLKGQEYRLVTVTVSVDRYAAANTYNLGIFLRVSSLHDGSGEVSTVSVPVNLVVLSPLSSGDAYNKIMGAFDNPLPEPFNGPLATAVITFLLWMAVGLLAMIIIIPALLRIFVRNHKVEGDKLKSGIIKLVPLVLMLFAFDSSLRVFGAAEEIVDLVENWFNVFYIVLGAAIAWKIYLIFVQYTVAKLSKNRRVDQKDVDIEPLLRLLGKLVISVVSVAVIMSTWGFSLTAIITGAGIASLGITLGAQNVLNQFFSGMVILLTRPFKSGDLVKIGTGATIYKVSCVNIMNTVFENWDNKETVIMPNNTVSSSTIVNLTGDGLIYKITVFINIAYDNDVDLAKKLMEDAAKEHPNVITNGSVDLPSTRVTAFLDSCVEIRLTGYVYDFNDSGKIGGELREAIFKSFKKNGINIPFPQMDVHLDMTGEEDPRKGRGG